MPQREHIKNAGRHRLTDIQLDITDKETGNRVTGQQTRRRGLGRFNVLKAVGLVSRRSIEGLERTHTLVHTSTEANADVVDCHLLPTKGLL